LQSSAFRRQLNGRAFVSDPDVFLLRRDGNSLTEQQRKALALVNGLCGGVLFTSDNPSGYDPGQRALLRRLPALWDAEVLEVRRDGGTLTVRFRAESGEETLRISL
jgi:alpha-galactosidase